MAVNEKLIEGASKLAQAETLAATAKSRGRVTAATKTAERIRGKSQAFAQAYVAKFEEDEKILTEYYDQMTDIDKSAVTTPQYRNAIGEYYTKQKKIYNDGADKAVKNRGNIESDEYIEGKQIMQNVNDEAAFLTKDISKYDQLKNTFAELVKLNGLPKGLPQDERDRLMSIFGDPGAENAAKMVIEGGKIYFDTPSGKTSLDDIKLPTDKAGQLKGVFQQDTQNVINGKVAIRDDQLVIFQNKYAELLDDQTSVVGFLQESMGPDTGVDREGFELQYQEIFEGLGKPDDKTGRYDENKIIEAGKKAAEVAAKQLQSYGPASKAPQFDLIEQKAKEGDTTPTVIKDGNSRYAIKWNPTTQKYDVFTPSGKEPEVFDSVEDIKRSYDL